MYNWQNKSSIVVPAHKRYLLISSEFPPGPGGIGKHAYCLAKALMHHNVSVTVVCNMDYASDDEIDAFKAKLPAGMRIVHIRRQGFATYLNRIKTIIALCKQQQFNKVIVSGQFSIWMGALLKVLYRRKLFIGAFVHGSELLIGGSIKRRLTQLSLHKQDALWPVSHYTKSLLHKEGVSKNIKLIPNGIDISEWEHGRIEKLPWKGYPNLLTTGSLTKRKGQHNIINALPVLIKQYPEIHYHMVGLPVQAEAIKQQAKLLSVENHITIYGRLSDVDLKKAYNTADVFCMLSEEDNGDVEGFGIAVLEANINGVPAIGSRNTGIEDAINDNVTGKLVDAHNAEEVLAAIQQLLTADKAALQANCRSWAVAHDWNEVVKSLL